MEIKKKILFEYFIIYSKIKPLLLFYLHYSTRTTFNLLHV